MSPMAGRSLVVCSRSSFRIEFGRRAESSNQPDPARSAATSKMIEEIRRKIEEDEFEFSQHALDQSILRQIPLKAVREAIATGEIIEDYPQDKYGPSCLIFGTTAENRPIHIQSSYPTRDLVKIITLYQPDPQRWVDYRTRRSRDE